MYWKDWTQPTLGLHRSHKNMLDMCQLHTISSYPCQTSRLVPGYLLLLRERPEHLMTWLYKRLKDATYPWFLFMYITRLTYITFDLQFRQHCANTSGGMLFFMCTGRTRTQKSPHAFLKARVFSAKKKYFSWLFLSNLTFHWSGTLWPFPSTFGISWGL